MGLVSNMPIEDIYVNPRTLSDGTVRYHYSTRRGRSGVKFWTTDGERLDLAKKLPRDFVEAYVEACNQEKERPSAGSFGALIARYRDKSSRYAKMRPKSKATRDKYLFAWAKMEMRNGKPAELAPIAVFDIKEIIPRLIDYRDATWGHSLSTAEEAQIALSAFLRWCKSEGRLNNNHAAALETPYERPTEGKIWEDWQQARFLADCSAPIRHGFMLALHTGLRLGDLIKLPVSAIKAQHIIIPTSKSGATAIVPISPTLRALLEDIEAYKAKFETESMTILVNTRGHSWTDAFKASFYKHRRKIDLGENPPSIHDLRKTAATFMVIQQHRYPHIITDHVLMNMFAWTPETLEKMKRIYVNDDAVITAITG